MELEWRRQCYQRFGTLLECCKTHNVVFFYRKITTLDLQKYKQTKKKWKKFQLYFVLKKKKMKEQWATECTLYQSKNKSQTYCCRDKQ